MICVCVLQSLRHQQPTWNKPVWRHRMRRGSRQRMEKGCCVKLGLLQCTREADVQTWTLVVVFAFFCGWCWGGNKVCQVEKNFLTVFHLFIHSFILIHFEDGLKAPMFHIWILFLLPFVLLVAALISSATKISASDSVSSYTNPFQVEPSFPQLLLFLFHLCAEFLLSSPRAKTQSWHWQVLGCQFEWRRLPVGRTPFWHLD